MPLTSGSRETMPLLCCFAKAILRAIPGESKSARNSIERNQYLLHEAASISERFLRPPPSPHPRAHDMATRFPLGCAKFHKQADKMLNAYTPMLGAKEWTACIYLSAFSLCRERAAHVLPIGRGINTHLHFLHGLFSSLPALLWFGLFFFVFPSQTKSDVSGTF